MNKISKTLGYLLTGVIMLASLAASHGVVSAQDGLTISAGADAICSEVQFSISWSNGSPPYLFFMDFGDGDTTDIIEVNESSLTLSHSYPDQGSYEWNVQVAETSLAGLEGSYHEILFLEGPEITLSSSPFPPIFVVGDNGLVEFTTSLLGGTSPYLYAWDLDGDGSYETDTGESASFSYTEVGKYYPQVMVTDGCGFTSSDTLPVVVADPENACHPTAQKIADGVNTIFPDQAADLYTCEDIYAIFDNGSEDNNIGFGQMWKAYNLAQSMVELTWEDILDWKLSEGGWGALLQLDRFVDLLEDHSLPELMALVMSDEYSLQDVRTAVRSVTRYEADFEDALARIAEGATPGELTQFYKLAGDLEVDPAELDAYLTEGLTLVELKQAAKFADRMDVDWAEIADARSMADSWGDINQAYKLATDEISAAEILIIGIQEYRESLRGEAKADPEKQTAQKEEKKTQETAEKLAEQFSLEAGEVMNLLNGECLGDWACVRQSLKEQQRTMADGFSEKDYQTALQIGSKYGFTQEEVLAYHQDYCGEDWTCTRSHFRNMYSETKETGKPDK